MATTDLNRPRSRPVFLESLDSIRPHRWSADGDPSAAPVNELLATLEAVAVLAMGDQITVPQSFAFDSGTFMALATRLLSAKGGKGDGPNPPISVALWRQDSFETAVDSMLARIKNNGFVSSLYPELNTGEWKLEDPTLASFLRLLGRHDTQRYAQLSRLALEFQSTAVDRATACDPLPVRVEGVRDFLEQRTLGPVDEQLTEALRLLSGPGAFQDRSLIRKDREWIGGGGRSAREILRNDATWELAVEVVDTLYNRVLADSLGVRHQSYSTPPDLSSAGLRARGLAQEYALDADLVRHRGEVSDAHRIASGFEYRLDSAAVLTQTESARITRTILNAERLDSALSSLLTARSEPGSDFWRSVRAVREAHARGDRKVLERRLADHHAQVAQILGKGFQVNRGIPYACAVTFTTEAIQQGFNALTMGPNTPAWVVASVAVGSATASVLGAELFAGRERRTMASATRAALTQIVRPLSEGPR